MRQGFKQVGLLVVLLVAITACRQQPIYTVENAPVASGMYHLKAAQVGSVIKQAATANGWTAVQVNATTLRCTNRWRVHVAVVDIAYSATSYSINLVSSEQLSQKNGTIHRKYNQRVQTLKNAIDTKLAQAL